MNKSKIKTVVHTGSNQWKDKTLQKYLVVFENDDNGTLTTGFKDGDKAPEVGEELEYNLEDKGFGNEVKLVKAGGAGGGFKAKAWSAEQIAQQDAVKLTVAYIEQRATVEDWKQFFIEAKAFMIQMIKADEASKPAELIEALKDPTVIDGTKDDLPF